MSPVQGTAKDVQGTAKDAPGTDCETVRDDE